MKFFSHLVVLALLFISSFAAPTGKAFSKRSLNFSLSIGRIASIVGALRSLEPTVDELHLGKRDGVYISFTLQSLASLSISLKRDAEEADEELSKRTEDYTLVVTSLTSGSGLSGRSTDDYAGRHVVVVASDSMVQGLEQVGVTQDQMPQYFSQALLATDPDTGIQYQLVPDNVSPNDITVNNDDIVLNVAYEPSA